MTAMLTVKSGMDPHMISRDFGWFVNGFIVLLRLKLGPIGAGVSF
jgi:hypothetical protein